MKISTLGSITINSQLSSPRGQTLAGLMSQTSPRSNPISSNQLSPGNRVLRASASFNGRTISASCATEGTRDIPFRRKKDHYALLGVPSHASCSDIRVAYRRLALKYHPNQSAEKINLLKALGAEVRTVPVVPWDDPNNYNHIARREAERLDNAMWGNQFDNTANRDAHYTTTGPEIWAQTGGQVDAWTCATGTGGTFAGVSQFLKEKNPKVRSVVADPPGSVLYKYYTTGQLIRSGSSITEGIGQGRVTKNMETALVDDAIQIEDRRSVEMMFRLLDEEGLFVGASSALNIVAAVDVAKQVGPGKTVVTILCDTASRYQSRLFSRSWIESKGLIDAVPEKFRSMLAP